MKQAVLQSSHLRAPGYRKGFNRHRSLLWMLVPGFALLILFNYVPMYGIIIAFKEFRITEGILGSPWIGLANFKALFSGPDFGLAMRNTVIISLLRIIFGFPAPIILALLLNEVGNDTYKKVIQTLSYLPHFLSWVILAGMLLPFFSLNGLINQMLNRLGIRSIEFLTNDSWFIAILIITGIWATIGWNSIVYIASIAGIDQELYEAAVIDGAGRWQKIWYITLPCLKPTIVMLFILGLGGILNAGFDQIYNMWNPMVYDVADILDTYMLRRLQKMDYALGTAAGLFKSLIGFFFIMITNKLAHMTGEEGIW